MPGGQDSSIPAAWLPGLAGLMSSAGPCSEGCDLEKDHILGEEEESHTLDALERSAEAGGRGQNLGQPVAGCGDELHPSRSLIEED